MKNSHFTVTALSGTFGAIISDIKLSEIDELCFAELYETWLQYALLIFPDQHLSNAEQIEFARRFGEPEFELAPISNVKADGTIRPDDQSDDVIKILRGNMEWHPDSTYMPVQAKGAVFTAHTLPSQGGQTCWADMRAAYDALASEMQNELSALSAHHSLYHSQAKIGHTHGKNSIYSGYGFNQQPPPLRPLVKIHPETGRPSLLIGRHAYGIVGMDTEKSNQLLRNLVAGACQEPRVYEHTWSRGDAVVWDNRCLLHKACPWDMNEPRVMFHSRIAGDPVTESGL